MPENIKTLETEIDPEGSLLILNNEKCHFLHHEKVFEYIIDTILYPFLVPVFVIAFEYRINNQLYIFYFFEGLEAVLFCQWR